MDTPPTEFNVTETVRYCQHHSMQINDALRTLRKYADKLNWASLTNVMDVGCGPADFTYNYLLPLLPQNGRITAVDVSSAMINYARTQYADEKRLKFDVVDVQNSNLIRDYKESFDLIFSSYCLHWVHDQRQALKNIFSMLKKGGHFVTLFLAKSAVCTLFEAMAEMDKWKPYLSNAENFIFPYHHDGNAQETLRTILTDTGFTINECVMMKASYTFPNIDVLLKTMNAAVPFVQRIPTDLVEDYNSDCLTIIEQHNLCTWINDKQVACNYNIFNVHCTKPSM